MRRTLLVAATAGLAALAACDRPTAPPLSGGAATLDRTVPMPGVYPRAGELAVSVIHPPGASRSSAVAINQRGTALIGSDIGSFLWSMEAGYVPVPIPTPRAVNDAEVVVGWSGNREQALVWSAADGLQQLPSPPGYGASFANDINNAGEIVGGAWGPPVAPPGPDGPEAVWVPVVWRAGVPEVLPHANVPLFFTIWGAEAINEQGDIVGNMQDFGENGVVLYWENPRAGGNPIVTGPPAPDGAFASDINAARQVTATSLEAFGEYGGFLWRRGSPWRELTPGFEINSAARAINDVGVIVGHVAIFVAGADRQPPRPMRWTEAAGVEELPMLPGTSRGDALDINNVGYIVGTLDDRATIWSPRCRAPGLEIVAWNGDTPGTISLSRPDVQVVVFNVEPHIPPHFPRASVNDLRLGDVWESATPANGYRVRDVNNDGRRDVQMTFQTQRLVDEGNLSIETETIMIWGRDPVTDERYCGITPVNVVP